MKNLGVMALTAALVVSPLSVTAPAATVAPAWSIASTASHASPFVVAQQDVRAVTCPTATNCFAVGNYQNEAGLFLPFVGHSNGSAWSYMPGAVPLGHDEYGPDGSLSGIACPTPTRCFAVGRYFDVTDDRALIEVGNANSWSLDPSPMPARSVLAGITCPTSTMCFAVGYSRTGNSHHTLIERWNGTTWSAVPSPTPHASGLVIDQLVAVSCSTKSSCLAVGASASLSGNVNHPNIATPLAERWDGKVWTSVKSAKPRGATVPTVSALSGLSCPSVTTCFAVGYSWTNEGSAVSHALVERWTGTRFSIVASPDSPGHAESQLSGVACPAEKSCLAIGHFGTPGTSTVENATLLERWNGKQWSIDGRFASANLGYPTSISCSTMSNCTAVGAYLIQRWNGSRWSAVLSGGASGSLYGVSCAGSATCFAVGSYTDYGAHSSLPAYGYNALVERWDGASWRSVGGATVQGGDVILSDVSCPTSATCFAVGDAGPDIYSPFHVLVERWNGTTWSTMPAPAPPQPAYSHLSLISCSSSTACLALGGIGTGTSSVPLDEQWDGTAWSIVNSDVAVGGHLAALSCVSASTCFAVGSIGTGTHAAPLVERWDGTSWSVVPSSGPPSSGFVDVTCSTATSCIAVGSSDGSNVPLVESWDGTKWSVVPSPSRVGATRASFSGVACSSATRCVAVGTHSATTAGKSLQPFQTLVEEWNGVAWSIVASPSVVDTTFVPSPTSSGLRRVSCLAGGRCFGVGGFVSPHSEHALIEASP